MPKTNNSTRHSRNEYAKLEPHVKTLKEGIIRKKWKKLPVGTQEIVANLLRAVERPAFTNGNNDRNDIEVQAAISELVQEIIQRLPRMPFPPGTEELNFDFESTINRQRVLEEQLTANTHTIGLLDAELEGESDLLEQEKAELDVLERALADLEESDGKQMRLHPFSQASNLTNPRTMPADYEMRSVIKTPATTLPDLEHDPQIKDVVDQLRHHLDSMQNNMEGTKEISAALATSQAALDVFTWRQLEKAEYSRVYGIDVM